MPFKLHKDRIDQHLSLDTELINHPRQVPDYVISRVDPKNFENIDIIDVNDNLAFSLGLTPSQFKSEEFTNLIAGQHLADDLKPFAMNYGGYQFGNWAGQLGDGRAIMLGGFETSRGLQYLQLKGSGPTPYSRRGDGFAVLRSSIREHLCSEAMYHLGIPTTRSLSLALTGEQVTRDPFYDGNVIQEPGAIVCRVAASFLRFGSYELPASHGNTALLKELVDFSIRVHYHHLIKITDEKQRYLELFKEICERTLTMVMHWQRVGFVHGVMNTDNMSILGLTIDYGPYGWMDDYNPEWTPNTTDNQHKRYKYQSQPEIALWNLWQLANTFYALIDDAKNLEQALNNYKSNYQIKKQEMMNAKLGFIKEHPSDERLIEELERLLPLHPVDMTIFYRELIKVNGSMTVDQAWNTITPAVYQMNELQTSLLQRWRSWLESYKKRLDENSAFAKARAERMQAANPKYVLRNYMAQLAIEAAEKGDYSVMKELIKVLKNPYEDQPKYDKWYARRPEWARDKPGCSQLSCSS